MTVTSELSNTKAKRAESQRKYRAANKEKCLAATRKWQRENREHILAYNAKVRVERPEHVKAKYRKADLKKKFGITPEQFEAMFVAQGSACAMCGALTSGTKRNFHVDHCHKTGTIRAILCHNCNLMLGHARDSTEILTAAISYLKIHSEGNYAN
jgi:hypothetical protein